MACDTLLETAMEMYDLEHHEIIHEELLETRVSHQHNFLFYTKNDARHNHRAGGMCLHLQRLIGQSCTAPEIMSTAKMGVLKSRLASWSCAA